MPIPNHMRTKALLAGFAVCAVIAALVASAVAGTQRAHGVSVTAAFTFEVGKGLRYSRLHLRITRGPAVAFDGAVRSTDCLAPWCAPAGAGSGQSSVGVMDLGPGERQDVVLSLFTQGAHCCFVDQVYSWDSVTRSYSMTERDFRDFPAAIERLGHSAAPVFVSADDAFAYTPFSVFATAGAPIQIWSFGAGKFHNVTRSYPRQIAADAAQWWATFKQHLNDGEGVIAAWAADEDLLGHYRLVSRTLATQAVEGHLHSLTQGAPNANKYIVGLQAFLRAHGYRP